VRRSKLGRSALRRTGDASSTGGGGGSNPGNIATWSLSLVRYILVDYDGGSDANLGYYDAAAGATIVPTGLAKKTITGTNGAMSIIPRDGNGRKIVVLVKNRAAGAIYLDQDGVTQTAVDFSGCYGYSFAGSRASSDLTNSATDKILLGAVVGYAGPNVDGSWTAAAGATVKLLTVAAGTLPAEPGSGAALDTYVGGMRLRFKGNVNAALVNVVTNVWKNGAGTSTIEFGQDIAAIPSTGDEFFLERVGTRFASFQDFMVSNPVTNAGSNATQVGFTVGFGAEGTAATVLHLGTGPAAGFQTYGFCEANGGAPSTQDRAGSRVQLQANYRDEAGTLRQCGAGLRAKGEILLRNLAEFASGPRGIHVTSGLTIIGIPKATSVGGGSYVGDGFLMGGTSAFENAFIGNSGTGGTVAKLRLVRAANRGIGAAGLAIYGRVEVSGVEFQDCSAGPCFLLGMHPSGSPPLYAYLEAATTAAAGGNTQYGVTLVGGTFQSYDGVVTIQASCTVTGTLGDIRFATDAVISTYAGLLRTNVIDRFDNNVSGAFAGVDGVIVGPCVPVTNSSGGAMAVGDVVRGNGTTAQITNSQADTLANSAVVGIMVTPPANGAVGYMATPGNGTPSVTCTAGPTAGAVVYLSVGTAARGTTTEPVLSGTQQKVKLGRVLIVSGSNARITFDPDEKPENTFDLAPIPGEVSNAAAAFSATQTWIIATGTFSADRAFTLEALSTLSVGTRRWLSDLTTGGAFNLVLTPNAADAIDGGAAGGTLLVPAGSRWTVCVRKTPTLGWKVE